MDRSVRGRVSEGEGYKRVYTRATGGLWIIHGDHQSKQLFALIALSIGLGTFFIYMCCSGLWPVPKFNVRVLVRHSRHVYCGGVLFFTLISLASYTASRHRILVFCGATQWGLINQEFDTECDITVSSSIPPKASVRAGVPSCASKSRVRQA